MILNHVDFFIQGEVVGLQVTIFAHIVWGHPGGLLQFSKGKAMKIFLASVSSGIPAMWQNREKRCAWTIAKRCGYPVVGLTSLFPTWWYHLIPNSFHKYQWSKAPIFITPLLVTAQPEPYEKIARMQVYTASVCLKWRFLTSRSGCLDSAQLNERWHYDARYQKSFELLSG